MTEMLYVYEHANFSKPAGEVTAQDSQKSAVENSPPSPGEVFEDLRTRDSNASARTIALDESLPQLHGLSLSGGGIRSASFCLGVVEALAELGVLNQFHYVSSVSGGGYAASWLAAWSYREPDGIAGVQRTLRETSTNAAPPSEVQHLSRYVTYLAPRAGALSADLWSLLSAYFRNLTITLGTTLPAVIVLASIPMMMALFAAFSRSREWIVWLAGVVCVFTVTISGLGMRILAEANDHDSAARKATLARGLAYVGPLLGGASFAITLSAGGVLSWAAEASVSMHTAPIWMIVVAAGAIAIGIATYHLVIGILQSKGLAISTRMKVGLRKIPARLKHCVCVPLSILVSLGVMALFELVVQLSFHSLLLEAPLKFAFATITLGPVFWCAAVLLGETFLQAVLSRELDDGDREWMARFGGLCLTTSVAWLLLCVATLWLPVLAKIIGVGWVWGSFLLLLLIAKWLLAAPRFLALAISVAATFCLCTIGFAIFFITDRWLAEGASFGDVELKVLYAGLGLFALAAALDLTVNINRFSMHALYRDRLVRTFLGASRNKDRATGDPGIPEGQEKQFGERVGSPFHNFDAHDNPQLNWLKSDASWRANHWMPIFLFNASLNRTWHTSEPGRMAKAFSFSFSPFFCGSKFTGYCETEGYVSNEGGFTLGAAMATSGAALSSRSGRFDNRLLAFFLTLLNLRLGTWLGNPNNVKTRVMAGPRSSSKAYLTELFGGSSERRDWIHLSDGGHFENLGTYELIRRGCRKIVAIDGSADPDRNFSDLSNLIRLAREELNVGIEPVSNIRIGGRELSQGRYAALFSVNYPEGASGRLIYIKPAFYSDTLFNVPIEVQSYAKSSSEFPHEPTMDQFFSAEQFDAYRRLGQHQIRTIFAGPKKSAYHLRDLFDLADEHTEVTRAGDAPGVMDAAPPSAPLHTTTQSEVITK